MQRIASTIKAVALAIAVGCSAPNNVMQSHAPVRSTGWCTVHSEHFVLTEVHVAPAFTCSTPMPPTLLDLFAEFPNAAQDWSTATTKLVVVQHCATCTLLQRLWSQARWASLEGNLTLIRPRSVKPRILPAPAARMDVDQR